MLMLADKQADKQENPFPARHQQEPARPTMRWTTPSPCAGVTPHITKNEKGRRSVLDLRTARHPDYGFSLSCRWLVERGVLNRQTIDVY